MFAASRGALIAFDARVNASLTRRSVLFHCIVVDANKCMSESHMHFIEVATTHRLGGQHGEEGKESEEGEEGEEEALIRRFRSLRLRVEGFFG